LAFFAAAVLAVQGHGAVWLPLEGSHARRRRLRGCALTRRRMGLACVHDPPAAEPSSQPPPATGVPVVRQESGVFSPPFGRPIAGPPTSIPTAAPLSGRPGGGAVCGLSGNVGEATASGVAHCYQPAQCTTYAALPPDDVGARLATGPCGATSSLAAPPVRCAKSETKMIGDSGRGKPFSADWKGTGIRGIAGGMASRKEEERR